MRISKILTAALGVVALASCNNEDSFFNSAEQNFTSTLKVNVAPMVGEDGTQTRAGFYVVDGTNYTTWQDGDKVRVYDDNLAKYNTYTRTSGTFGTTGTQEASAYQLSPAGFVTYAGWKEGTGLTALVNIPAQLTYDEFEKDDNNTAYISNIPLFGKVNSIEGGVLESSNVYLTGFLKVTLKNGYNMDNGIKSIKVTAMKWNSGAWAAADADKKPLSGNFDAVLDPSDNFGSTEDTQKSKLQKGTEELVNYGYSSSILVKTSTLNISSEYESLVYIPIVPDTYDRIQIDLCSDANGSTSVTSYAMGKSTNSAGTAKVIKAGHWYANADFIDEDGAGTTKNFVATTDLNKKMEKTYDLSYSLAATTTTEINDYLSMLTSSKGSVTVKINSDNALTVATENTQAKMNTIFIPALQGAMTLNIGNATNGMSIANNDLTITDAAGVTDFTKPITINITKFATEATKKVIIKTKRPIAIAGDFTNISTATAVTACNTPTLTLGTEAVAFKTKTGDGVGNVDVKADTENGEVAIQNIVVEAAAETAITNLTNTDGAALEVKGGTITNLNLVKEVDQAITMRGASTITNIVAPTADLTKNTVVNVTTYDKAVIVTPNEKTTTANTKTLRYTFTAHVTDETAAAGTPQANIYTAAQLLKLSSCDAIAPVLKANVVVDEGATWNPLTLDDDITADFDGNSKSISGLNAPLFATLKNGVKNLALTNVKIEATTNTIGALAKEFSVTADKSIENVTVAGSTIGATYSNGGVADQVYNVGGLFGKVTASANKTLTIKNCGVKFEAIQGYYNLGGFIGLADASTSAFSVSILKKTDNNVTANSSNIDHFYKSFWAPFGTDLKCGSVGDFIGSLDGTNAIAVTVGAANDTFSTFFSPSTDVITNTAMTTESAQAGNGLLEFARNNVTKNIETVATKLTFSGMSGATFTSGTSAGMQQLIGYSTATAIGTITVYNKTAVYSAKKSNNKYDKITYADAINAYGALYKVSGDNWAAINTEVASVE